VGFQVLIKVVKEVKAAVAGAAVVLWWDAKKATLGGVLEGVTSRKEEFHLGCPRIRRRGPDRFGSTKVIGVGQAGRFSELEV
jgi:hypothetical protein